MVVGQQKVLFWIRYLLFYCNFIFGNKDVHCFERNKSNFGVPFHYNVTSTPLDFRVLE